VLGTVIGKIFMIFVSFSIFACGLVIFITGSRITWAMSRDGRFPGSTLFRQVHPTTNTPAATTALLFVLMQVLLAIFSSAGRADVLANLFSASTLLPCIIYLFTVLLYIRVRNNLPETAAFRLGAFEWPVIVLALIWLLFELSIFRDKSFTLPWEYVGVMFAIGLVYFAYLWVSGSSSLKTNPTADLGGETARA
jgi:amino acid transporter